MNRKELSSILIKPAGPDCNLNCAYCFYLEKGELFTPARRHRMNEETLKAIYRQIGLLTNNYISLTWQGGEPTLMGLPFYRKSVELQKKYAPYKSVDYGFQTNGINLNKFWARFFRENNFLIGLSLDGPAHVHDKYRLNKRGKGTFGTVYDNARMLLDEDVKVNAMIAVNDYSVQFPDEIYNFHKELGLTFMQFIPILELSKEDRGINAPFSVSPDKYGEFLCRIFDLWMNDFSDGMPATSVRNFESVFFRYAGFESPECTFQNECGNYLVIEHNGNVYPCDFFVEENLLLGNVNDSLLADMLNSPAQKEFGQLKSRREPECAECKWLNKCFGGCTKDRLKNSADKNHFYFCESFKMFYEHSDESLTKLANDWKAKNL